ncbi:DUF1206 domain-containing protein [Streptomyces sp. NPDC002566]|uniref:DUF1206 domain-containing protein n=1 Tax=Streptomyces sp. NPDC002566 TaxID=3364650 RepID=UPI00368089A8
MNASAMARGGRAQAERAARGSVTKGAARAGLTARGVIYLLVGLLALQIAFGEDKSQEADRQGALAEISQRPFGSVLLWALGIGLVGMALWRLSEVVFGSVGPEGRKPKKRLMALARCAFYSFVAYSVLAFAAGSGSGGGSSDEQSRDVTARVLELPGGQWIVGAGGIGIVVAGLWIGGRAVLRKYRDKMRMGQMSPAVRRAVDVTGVGGGAARGLVFAAAGVFAVRAAVDYRPDQAKGLDDTLRSFADTPAGPCLLACVAAGLVLFGLFSFAMARWRKV